jgi:hypothetical protein
MTTDQIDDLNIFLLEQLTGLDTTEVIKIPRRELLSKCHDRYLEKAWGNRVFS